MANSGVSVLHGSLDGLVLKSLSWGPMHGFGVTAVAKVFSATRQAA